MDGGYAVRVGSDLQGTSFRPCRLTCRMSHHALRGQILAYCNSLRALLDDFPAVRDTFFMVGQPQEKKTLGDSTEGLEANPR